MKQLRKCMVGLAGAALIALAPATQAAMITLTDAQIDAFVIGGPNTSLASSSVLGFVAPNGAQFGAIFSSVCFNESTAGTCKAVFELTGQSIVFGGSDTFSIDVYNSNASPWEFTLTIIDTLFNQLTTSTIIAGDQQTMTISSNGTVNPIQTILMTVRDGTQDLDNNDAIANFNLYTVPEPGALALLGIGLGLLGMGRRRRLAIR